jgi:hypothetical protein
MPFPSRMILARPFRPVKLIYRSLSGQMTPDQRLQVEHHLETALLPKDSESEIPIEPSTPSILSQVLWLLSRPRLLLSLLLGLLRQLLVVSVVWCLVHQVQLLVLSALGR